MDIAGKRIWQVAAGDTNRDYADLLLCWDVIAIGPGHRGRWPDCEAPLRKEGRTEGEIGNVKRFCEDMDTGDLIVLRLGTSDVYGVGEVVGDYEWLDDFGDVDGWSLQHVRRVRWLWKYTREPKHFDTHTLRFGNTVQRMNSESVITWLQELKIRQEDYKRSSRSLPPSCQEGKRIAEIEESVIGDYLFDHGIAAGSIDALLAEMKELVRIARWYQRMDEKTSEYETIAYLIVPLLRALGWTPQKMAVEWKRMDIALFDKMPRKDNHLVALVEAKRLNRSCLTAIDQAIQYANQDGHERCLRLIVTDGLRYAVYVRSSGENFWDPAVFRNPPVQAYLNLTRMMDSYPILECHGAKEALLLMAADWNGVLPDTPRIVP